MKIFKMILKNQGRLFLVNQGGQFAVIAALLSVPVVLMIGATIDIAMLSRDNEHIQSALDSAVLAAVTPGDLSSDNRESYAKEAFYNNYAGPNQVELKAVANHNRVDMMATLSRETVFMGAFGYKTQSIKSSSAAEKSSDDLICVMTLDPSKKGSLTIKEDAEIIAPNCSIHVNSTNIQAIRSVGNFKPMAKRICSSGGIYGKIGPEAKANCQPTADPYANRKINYKNQCDYTSTTQTADSSNPPILAYNEFNKTMEPGVYCGGLHIHNSSVKLRPGTYIVKDGPLTIGQNAIVDGRDVTFILDGPGSVLYTYGDIEINLEAPKVGPTAGFIFYQVPGRKDEATSIIKGGVNIRLVGTSYFPNQDLYVGGNGKMGANTPAMAFIANNITFTSDIDRIILEHNYILNSFENLIDQSTENYHCEITDYRQDNDDTDNDPALVMLGMQGREVCHSHDDPCGESGIICTFRQSDSGSRSSSPMQSSLITIPVSRTDDRGFKTMIQTSVNSAAQAGALNSMPRAEGGTHLITSIFNQDNPS